MTAWKWRKERQPEKQKKQNGAATFSHNESIFISKMNMATTWPEQKRQPNKRKGPALNEKL